MDATNILIGIIVIGGFVAFAIWNHKRFKADFKRKSDELLNRNKDKQ